MNEFFDKVVVLTTNRRQRCERELAKYGIDAEFFQSLSYHPKKSFNLSMKMILQRFVDSGGSSLLILEDDVLFRHEDKWKDVFDELSKVEWDVLYLGGNYNNHGGVKQPEYVSEHLRRIYNAWTTHAVGFNQKTAQYVVANYNGVELFDAWLDSHVLGKFVTMATYPMLAVQEADYSSIWGHHVDYAGVWSGSEEFIK